MKGFETHTEPIQNGDDIDGVCELTYLEAAPPVMTFYDVSDTLKRYVYGTAEARLQKSTEAKDALIAAKDIQGFYKHRADIRARFHTAMGGMPEAAEALDACVTGMIEKDGYRVEKVIFTARPKVYVTGHLYVPEALKEPTGAVLFVCGHAENAKLYPRYQFVCRLLAKAGLVALIIDPVGQGERFSYIDTQTGRQRVVWGCPEHDHAGGQALPLGLSTARYFLHDAMRGVDFLTSREEVDPARIGVTGSSGGGTQTALMMLKDDRIAAAAPGTFISDIQSIMRSGVVQDAEQIWNGLLEHGFDHDDILLAVAPKPVMILSVSYDFFPIEGTNATFESAVRFYELLGKRANVELVTDRSPHQFTPLLARRAADFFSRHLLGRPFDATGIAENPITEAEGLCTKSGQIAYERPESYFIYDELADEANVIKASREAKTEAVRKAEAIGWLTARVNHNRIPCAANPRIFGGMQAEGLLAESLVFWTNPNFLSNALIFTADGTGQGGKTTLALWENGTSDLAAHGDWIRARCYAGERVIVADLSGFGPMTPARINAMPMHGFEGTLCGFAYHLLWQNDSLTALRAFEILRCISVIQTELHTAPQALSVYGAGYPALPVAMAALVAEEEWGGLQLENLPLDMQAMLDNRVYNHNDVMNRVLPGAFQYFDYAELCRWAQARHEGGKAEEGFDKVRMM